MMTSVGRVAVRCVQSVRETLNAPAVLLRAAGAENPSPEALGAAGSAALRLTGVVAAGVGAVYLDSVAVSAACALMALAVPPHRAAPQTQVAPRGELRVEAPEPAPTRAEVAELVAIYTQAYADGGAEALFALRNTDGDMRLRSELRQAAWRALPQVLPQEACDQLGRLSAAAADLRARRM